MKRTGFYELLRQHDCTEVHWNERVSAIVLQFNVNGTGVCVY